MTALNDKSWRMDFPVCGFCPEGDRNSFMDNTMGRKKVVKKVRQPKWINDRKERNERRDLETVFAVFEISVVGITVRVPCRNDHNERNERID